VTTELIRYELPAGDGRRMTPLRRYLRHIVEMTHYLRVLHAPAGG
jgi:hypothetical protein